MKTLFEVPTETEVIRALWWKQPFASLMLHGKIETRTYPTNVRGKVLICATKKEYSYESLIQISGRQTLHINSTLQVHHSCLPLGKAIAIADFKGCRPMTIVDEAKCFVRYREPWIEQKIVWDKIIKRYAMQDCHKMLWCWIFENVQPIENFEIKGKQGWAILDEETKSKIKILK